MTYRSALLMRLGTAAAAGVIAVAVPATAYAQPREFRLDIPAQDLGSALKAIAAATGEQVTYQGRMVQTRTSSAVRGTMSADEAVAIALRGTGLKAGRSRRGVIVVSLPAGRVHAATFSDQAGRPAPSPQSGPQRLQGASDATDDAEEEEIVVTGTNIRGIAPESSPTRAYTREEIQRSGAATAQEFIAKLPENFGGGSNPNIPGSLPNDSAAGSNSGGFGSYGSSVNLRGLGSGSTLVLLNGHRVAPSSIIGDFVDIAMIPAAAIERVETLTDGASSVYGSDAVAGVVNFILRDDFEGLETSLRVGTGTESGTPDQFRASVVAGKGWGTGNALLIYEHFDQEALRVEDRDFARKNFAPSFLLPSQRRNSVFGALSQHLANGVTARGDGLYSRREARQLRTDRTGNRFQYDSSSEVLNLSANLGADLGRDWYLDVIGTFGEVKTVNTTSGTFTGERDSQSREWNADARINGMLLAMPAGDLKVALGAHYRNERLHSSGVTITPLEQFAERDVYALYGEAFVPLISPAQDIPALRRVELNLSGRYSDYSDFGSTFDPKIGVLVSPFEGLNLRGSYSTSFKAPPLGLVGALDLSASLFRTSFLFPIFGLTPADPSLADVIQMTVAGTDNELDPETSRAITAGIDFNRRWGENALSASATWFDIDFRNRLGNIPIPGNVVHFNAINLAFDDPSVFPDGSFTFQPSRDEIDGILASLENPLINPFGLDPYQTFFVSRLLVVTNTSRSIARGLDFSIDYNRALGSGSLNLGLDGTWLKDFRRQAVPTTPVVQNIDTVFNPADLKLRGSASYSGRNFSAAAFVNYVDGYRTNNTPAALPIGSWTTVDLSLMFDTRDNLARGGPFANTAVRLSVTNLFDRDPPTIPLFADIGVDGYDPTNASPLGRFVSLELIKRF